MTAALPQIPVALYRLYNLTNDLLYIGISAGPWQRFTQHAGEKTWWADVARAEIEWHPAREIAQQAERDAIRAERPKHNTRHALSEQGQSALEVAVAAAHRAVRLHNEAWEAIKAARDAGVLDTDLCGDMTPARFNRATLNRKFGPRSA